MAAPVEAINRLAERVAESSELTKEEALFLTTISHADILDLFSAATRIRSLFRGNRVELCSIINAKSGACSEDCSFCAQSSRSTASIDTYPLVSKDRILQKAREARQDGIRRFSIVTSGRTLSHKHLDQIAETISAIRELGVTPCASLGLLTARELSLLKSAGLDRYHHNLESSPSFFPTVCSTHGYSDKIRTIRAAQSVGLSICSGGIFGMGESWEDRIEMAFALRELEVDSIPINFLIPIKGTALGDRPLLPPLEALKIVSLYRFILPRKEIRICGGRLQVLGELNAMIFYAGADGMITGNYLTTMGRNPHDDHRLIRALGLQTDDSSGAL